MNEKWERIQNDIWKEKKAHISSGSGFMQQFLFLQYWITTDGISMLLSRCGDHGRKFSIWERETKTPLIDISWCNLRMWCSRKIPSGVSVLEWFLKSSSHEPWDSALEVQVEEWSLNSGREQRGIKRSFQWRCTFCWSWFFRILLEGVLLILWQ